MISQADILKTLINNNCTDESVMSTALSPDCTPPKLLEKLTEAERFDLALDISMKLGLDVMPLWRTWAMRCLRNRNFQGARDKFRHCFLRLRLPGGRTSPVQSKLLADILNELTRMDETQLQLSDEIELIKRRKRLETTCNVAQGAVNILGGSSGGPGSSEDAANDDVVVDDDIISHKERPSVSSKPKIYTECIHYLTDYGGVQDFIRFYARNYLWDETIKVLLEKSSQINLDKFFVGEVLLFSTSVGHLGDLVGAFLKSDPNVAISAKFFKAMYNFCLRNRRYHVLYYIQSTIRDYIAAASTQITFFFLRKPVQSYRELNHRIASLALARENYQNYLHKMGENWQPNSSLFTLMNEDEVHSRIKLIDLQIDITRDFAINEVSGCVNGIDLGSGSPKGNKTPVLHDFPVTLFETDPKRKTFLAALVLIYYDLSCNSYFSENGLKLANQLINDSHLDKLSVFKNAMRILIDDESCDILENASLLLERIREDYSVDPNNYNNKNNNRKSDNKKKQSSDDKTGRSPPAGTSSLKSGSGTKPSPGKTVKFEPTSSNSETLIEAQMRTICDEVIGDSIGSCNEPDYKMELAKLLSGEAKIELYIKHGKLSNAQRLACNMNRPDYVIRIIEQADRLNQNHVKTVCQLWLAKHETKNLMK